MGGDAWGAAIDAGNPGATTCRFFFRDHLGPGDQHSLLGTPVQVDDPVLGTLYYLDLDASWLAQLHMGEVMSEAVRDGVLAPDIANQALTETFGAELAPVVYGSAQLTGSTDTPWDAQLLATYGTPPTPGPGVVVADSGNGMMTDAGPINGYGDLEQTASPPLQPDPPREAAGGSIGLDELGEQLSAAQAQQLQQALANLGLDAQALAAVSVYTNADGSRILANAEGEIIGTVQPLGQGEGQTDSGWLQVRLNGQGEPVYLGPQGQAWSEHRYNEASAQDAAGAMNLVGSLAGLQNWSQLNAAQQLSALANIKRARNGHNRDQCHRRTLSRLTGWRCKARSVRSDTARLRPAAATS